MIPAGFLDQRIRFLEPVETVGDRLDASIVFTDRGGTWAKVEAAPGREAIVSDAVTAQPDLVATIRFRSPPAGFSSAWRIRWRGRDFSLAADPIDPNGRGEILQLVAVAGRPD